LVSHSLIFSPHALQRRLQYCLHQNWMHHIVLPACCAVRQQMHPHRTLDDPP
jgi:hypothetical protein